MNTHEQAVRAAVDKTQKQSRLSAATYRVERAQKAIDEWKAKGASLRAAFDVAQAELAKAKLENV